MRDRILEYIRKNRVSSVEVSDALGKRGVLEGIVPLNRGQFVAGTVSYVATWDESNWPLHEQVMDVPNDTVIYVDAIRCGSRGLFGDIVSKYLYLYKGVSGIVTNGLVRDVHRLRKEYYPLWCAGITPMGCFNRQVEIDDTIRETISAGKKQFGDSILVCDDSGCTLIKAEEQTQELLDRLEFIEIQEDIWYFCTDTLKLSTYETICRKVYLENPDLLPESLRIRLKEQI